MVSEGSFKNHPSSGLNFFVEGMRCSKCVFKIEEGLRSVGLAHEARVNLASASLIVTPSASVSSEQIVDHLASLGFQAKIVKTKLDLAHNRSQAFRRSLVRLGVAGACSGNIMIFAVAVYAGADPETSRLFDWLSLGLFLPVILFSAQEFFANSYQAIKARRASVDLPIALALGLGTTLSTYHLFNHSGEVYYDSMSALVFLLLASRLYLQSIQQKYLLPVYLDSFLNSEPVLKRNPRSQQWEFTSWQDIAKGDLIKVLPGEKLPADGELTSEHTYLNTSMLTGESLPQKVSKHSLVFAGTQVESLAAEIKVLRVKEATRLGQILKKLQEEVMNKTPLVSLTDRFAQRFTLIVLLIGGTFLAFYSLVDLDEAVRRALALSLVSCPCALVFATPLAQSFAISMAAKKGYFFQKASALEKLTEIETIFFDKTGTLTQGQVKLLSFWPNQPDAEVASVILGLENSSSHPIALAIKRDLGDEGSAALISNWQEHVGRGVSGFYKSSFYELSSAKDFQAGRTALLKTQHLFEDRKVEFELSQSPEFFERSPELPTESGISWNVLLRDGKPVLWMSFTDPLRPDSKTLIEKLQKKNLSVIIASGDQKQTVEEIGRQLGVDPQYLYSELSPEKKAELVQTYPRVLMVGDGHNDSLALAQAHVGIAVHGSMESSLRASEVYLTAPGVQPIAELLRLAGETMKVIKRSLVFSLIYNLAAGSAALFGFINPLVAAILMPLSSFFVLSHVAIGTSWLRTFGKTSEPKTRPSNPYVEVQNFLNSPLKTEKL